MNHRSPPRLAIVAHGVEFADAMHLGQQTARRPIRLLR